MWTIANFLSCGLPVRFQSVLLLIRGEFSLIRKTRSVLLMCSFPRTRALRTHMFHVSLHENLYFSWQTSRPASQQILRQRFICRFLSGTLCFSARSMFRNTDCGLMFGSDLSFKQICLQKCSSPVVVLPFGELVLLRLFEASEWIRRTVNHNLRLFAWYWEIMLVHELLAVRICSRLVI